jgi:hypothetical protein
MQGLGLACAFYYLPRKNSEEISFAAFSLSTNHLNLNISCFGLLLRKLVAKP